MRLDRLIPHVSVEALVEDLQLVDLDAGGAGGRADEDVLGVESGYSHVRGLQALRAGNSLQRGRRQRLVHVVL